MLTEYFRVTITAVVQLFLLAAIGFFLVKKNILGSQGLDALSRLIIEITLPFLIFTKLVKDFSFTLYPQWWIFPLISILITAVGLAAGGLFSVFINGRQHKLQFLSLAGFQNSGFLPLALITVLLPGGEADRMLIYLFLFLMGFNLVMWSLGVYMLSFHKNKKFELGSLFSPPVIATMLGLIFILLGLNRIIPEFIIKPLKVTGNCTVPIALLVVGGNLAQIHLGKIYKRAVFLAVSVKLILLPALGVLLTVWLKLPALIGLLVVMQLAMPSATSLSVIIRHYKKEDLLISQGIFFSHLASVATIPVFLSLYFALSMIK